MNKRKKLTEIQAAFDLPPAASRSDSRDLNSDPIPAAEEVKDGSLSATLKVPKKSAKKIRFTLDLEKPLDDRLNKASSKLNRSKAELVRFAVQRLLEELESEWKN